MGGSASLPSNRDRPIYFYVDFCFYFYSDGEDSTHVMLANLFSSDTSSAYVCWLRRGRGSSGVRSLPALILTGLAKLGYKRVQSITLGGCRGGLV